MQPSIGRIVLFTIRGAADPAKAVIRPAIITGLCSEEGRVHLSVFTVEGDEIFTGIKADPVERAPRVDFDTAFEHTGDSCSGMWHWPPRVGA